MKKITTFVLALVASMCSLTSWATERVAPTEPTVTLTNGGEYYLYNVDYDNAVHYNAAASSYIIFPRPFSSHATKVTITPTDDGYYTIKLTDANMYFYRSSWDIQANTSSKTDFSITEVDGGYTFQTPNYSYYDESQYMGFVSGSDCLRGDATSNIVWKILPAEDESFDYIARLRLYSRLCLADKYGSLIDQYEAIYADEASTNEELNNAADELWKTLPISNGYQAPWWNERPILFYTADGSYGQNSQNTWALPDKNYTTGSYFLRQLNNNRQSSISATVLVDEPSTLVYGLDGSYWFKVEVDGVEVRNLYGEQLYNYPSYKTHTRFFEELEPGVHTITWTCGGNNTIYDYGFCLYDVGVMSKQQISVNLLEPGSLGTEVLYNTDHIKNVRRLKVKGPMNNDDWGRIKMMSTLLELDLSEAQFTEIPAKQFYVSSSDTTMNFLHKVVLPEGMTTIGDQAFNNSFVEDINLPSTMKRVGRYAFAYSHVKELIMPDDMTDFCGGSDYGYCFQRMFWLQKLVLPKNLTRIPSETFYEDAFITEAVMPEKLETIGESAFNTCWRMQTTLPEGLKTIEDYAFYRCNSLNSPLPETLTTIGERAFQYVSGYTSLVIPQSVTSIGQYAFADCTNMETAELSVYQYSLANGVFQNCSKLKTVKLNSPTVTTISSTYPLSDITQVTLQVPHYLVNEYKLHSYWYNAKSIEPFDYSDTEFIPISGKLTLNHERFGGQPSIEIRSFDCYLKINGDDEQKFNNIKVNVSGSSNSKGQLLNNCDNITASGDNILSFGTEAKKWYFISLPFDLDVSRITPDDGVQYAIRYYDGAGRAANGKSGNWKNVDRTSIIPAGTGFIFQTNNTSWTWFYAADTENKYGTLRNTEFIKTLDVNASETASNKGWNLVGNPYQCFYNNHCLNFTAPITVWNPDQSTYTAYSLTDDDYAIRPNEAFFVQCPNEEYNTIGFPLQGRQLTSVIESQNAVKAQAPEAQMRQVVNLTVSNGEMEDMTRVVLNEKASMTYETSCDASKFMSMDGSVPQIYTLDAEGTWYAINERPMGEGLVALGFYAGQDGTYTISVTRCDAEKVFITDNQTGETTEITNGAYTFSALAGTDNTRFTLSFVANNPTAIQKIDQTANSPKTDIYSVDGKFQGNDASRLGAGVYVIRQGKKTSKVIVK